MHSPFHCSPHPNLPASRVMTNPGQLQLRVSCSSLPARRYDNTARSIGKCVMTHASSWCCVRD